MSYNLHSLPLNKKILYRRNTVVKMRGTMLLAVMCGLVAMVTAQDFISSRQGYRSSYDTPSSTYYGGRDTYSGSDYYKPRDKVVIYQQGFKGGRYYYGGHYKGETFSQIFR